MHTTLPRPPPHLLPQSIKHNPKRTPQENQTHIQHDRRHKPRLLDPGRNELRKPIPPNILIDGDGDHDTARNRLVAVDGVRRRDGGDRRDL